MDIQAFLQTILRDNNEKTSNYLYLISRLFLDVYYNNNMKMEGKG